MFFNVKVTKVKETRETIPDQRRLKIWQAGMMCGPGLDPFPIKFIIMTTGEI